MSCSDRTDFHKYFLLFKTYLQKLQYRFIYVILCKKGVLENVVNFVQIRKILRKLRFVQTNNMPKNSKSNKKNS